MQRGWTGPRVFVSSLTIAAGITLQRLVERWHRSIAPTKLPSSCQYTQELIGFGYRLSSWLRMASTLPEIAYKRAARLIAEVGEDAPRFALRLAVLTKRLGQDASDALQLTEAVLILLDNHAAAASENTGATPH